MRGGGISRNCHIRILIFKRWLNKDIGRKTVNLCLFFLWEVAIFFFYLSVEMGGSRPKGSPIRLIVFYDPRQPVINVVIQWG